MNLDLFQKIMRDDYGQKMTMYDNSRVFTPEKIAKQMVDMLPDQVWDPKTKFLDPCCKTGVFLIEIYNKLDEALQKLPEYSDKPKRRNHILNNQIFGIALDDESLVYSRRNVAGDIFYENIQYIPQFMRYIKNKDYAEIKKLLKQEEVFKMDKFDVVIGNPPYQENNSTNGRQSKQLYDKFILAGIDMSSRIVSFITNNTFLSNDSKQSLRDSMIRAGLCRIEDYPISGDVFPNVGVSVAIQLMDKGISTELNGGGNLLRYKKIVHNTVVTEYESIVNVGDTIRESGIEVSISDKVKGYTSLSGIVLGDKVFGIQSSGLIGFSGDGDIVKISQEKTATSVALLNKFEKYKSVDYIEFCDIPKGTEYVNCFKVICPHACSRAQLQTFDKSSILKPGYIHTENWTQFGPFQNVYESYNLCVYMRTNLFKFLCYLYCSSAMTKVSKVLMSHVPLQDFTSDSDIDWSKSIEDIDKQLYRKYNLTQEEIDYIEKTIKPMK